MCAQYLIKTRISQLESFFGITPAIPSDWEESIDGRIFPFYRAPVVVSNGQKKLTLSSMIYSLTPSYSLVARPKFATYNARIETVADKPTWRIPFRKKRLLVPMSRFVESISDPEIAPPELLGNLVQFFEKNEALLFAAGIYDEWRDERTGQITKSFAILTDQPPSFVLASGHDRCPIFLKESAWVEWLDPREQDPRVLIELLRGNTQAVEFAVAVDRPLKKKPK